MTLAPPRRIVVLGPPGSGKSTLARHLGAMHSLPVFHLDRAYWCPGWVEAEPTAFHSEVERIARLPAWVIDGNYNATIAPRLAAADTVIYLDMPAWRCVPRILRRWIANRGRVRIDAAPGCREKIDLAFLRFAWGWNRSGRARALALLETFPHRRVVLRGPRAVAGFLHAFRAGRPRAAPPRPPGG